MSTGFAATLTGKLKSMFGKTSDSDNPALPALESRKDDFNSTNNDDSNSSNNEFYNTDKQLLRVSNGTEFDVVNFDDEQTNHQENHSLTNLSSSPNSLNSLNSLSSLSSLNPVFSVELEQLRDDITSHISISDEKVGEGHALLSKAFSVPDELLSLISPTIAKQYKVLPLEVVEVIEVKLVTDNSTSSTLAQSPSISTLSILYCDEILRQMCEEQIVSQLVSKGLNYQLRFVSTNEESLIETIDYVYSTINSSLLVAEQERLAERHSQIIQQMDAEVETPTGMVFDIKVAKEHSPFEEILVRLFCEVHMRRGTDCDIDLNIIPKPDGTEITELLVKTRIDNSIVVIKRERMSIETYQKLIVVLKTLAELDTGKNRSQMTGYITGRLIYGTRSPKIEMRVNLIPTGKKRIASMSIRFQSQHENNFTIENIGFFTSDEKLLNENVFYATDGLVIICGKVNCGKNTTLIALINKLKQLHPDKKIILLEDPIEQVLPDVLQIQVDSSNKETGYGHFLRAALRHNPDILGVGETRDAESANLVLEAASVGHITFTTFHTTDSTKAIERMVSLTKDTSKVSDSLRCVISQKLVKKICTKCVHEIDSKIPNIVNLDSYIAKTGWKAEVQFTRATGKLLDGRECPYCNGTGFYGRIGIFEILTFSEKTKDLILKNSPAYQIRKQVIKEGLRSLFLNGLVRVLMGEVTLGELIKQTGYPNAQKEGVSFEYDSDSVNNELN